MTREVRGIIAGLLLGGTLTFGVFSPLAARAEDPAVADPNPCKIEGWFVNPDEADREPTRTYDGFVFESADLIHHGADLRLDRLKPGWYAASPAPDQSSFFSVEVRDLTTDAYGTLRWDKGAAVWSITIGAGTGPGGPATAGTFTGADPVELLKDKVTKWGKFTNATRVVTFGVGYTKNPPGTVKTTVTSVTFQGKVHSFKCVKPTASPTTSPTVSTSPTATVSATATTTPSSSSSPTPSRTASATPSASKTTVPPVVTPVDPAAGEDELPVTGASLGTLIGAGAAVFVLGGIILFFTRRRRVR